ncbi:hypothetical protein ACOMCU_25190 [Lysinibacillus sp. UGB7]|uniref:hypothetical protein n=1 Tax=Lysinibacillus sp. UGB7 TaxID=3411039 RepID=UPI003B799EAE
MKFLQKKTKVIVRSRISKKELIRPIADYVDGKLYNSIIEYLELHMREIKRTGFSYSFNEIVQNPEIFQRFVDQLVHPDYIIDYGEIDEPIWIIKSYKKSAPLFLIPASKSVPNPTLKFLNQVLSTYGYINKKPKYEAKSIKPNVQTSDEG